MGYWATKSTGQRIPLTRRAYDIIEASGSKSAQRTLWRDTKRKKAKRKSARAARRRNR